jgi:hypothetical protein
VSGPSRCVTGYQQLENSVSAAEFISDAEALIRQHGGKPDFNSAGDQAAIGPDDHPVLNALASNISAYLTTQPNTAIRIDARFVPRPSLLCCVS